MAAALPSAEKLLPKPRVKLETTSTAAAKIAPPKWSRHTAKTPSQTSLDSKGTVLLRQPLPKYSFQASKKPTAIITSTSSANPLTDHDTADDVALTTVSCDHESVAKPRPVSKVDPLPNLPATSSANVQFIINIPPQLAKFPSLESLPFPDPLGTQISFLQTENTELKDKNARLRKEMENMKRQLDVQFQVFV